LIQGKKIGDNVIIKLVDVKGERMYFAGYSKASGKLVAGLVNDDKSPLEGCCELLFRIDSLRKSNEAPVLKAEEEARRLVYIDLTNWGQSNISCKQFMSELNNK
jgi:hypothetical protein